MGAAEDYLNKNALRVLRENWKNPAALSRELYTMFSDSPSAGTSAKSAAVQQRKTLSVRVNGQYVGETATDAGGSVPIGVNGEYVGSLRDGDSASINVPAAPFVPVRDTTESYVPRPKSGGLASLFGMAQGTPPPTSWPTRPPPSPSAPLAVTPPQVVAPPAPIESIDTSWNPATGPLLVPVPVAAIAVPAPINVPMAPGIPPLAVPGAPALAAPASIIAPTPVAPAALPATAEAAQAPALVPPAPPPPVAQQQPGPSSVFALPPAPPPPVAQQQPGPSSAFALPPASQAIAPWVPITLPAATTAIAPVIGREDYQAPPIPESVSKYLKMDAPKPFFASPFGTGGIGGGGGGTTTFIGQVQAGSGGAFGPGGALGGGSNSPVGMSTCTVVLYPDGPTGDPGDTVTVTILQLAATETIPNGTWLDCIQQFTDQNNAITYCAQVPIWLA